MLEKRRASDLATLREAVSAKVAATSLRAVSGELGMPPNSIRNFVAGRDPYGQNLRRFREWYVREVASSDGDRPVDSEAASAALDLLVRHLSAPLRAQTRKRLLRALASAMREMGVPTGRWPKWLPKQKDGKRQQQ